MLENWAHSTYELHCKWILAISYSSLIFPRVSQVKNLSETGSQIFFFGGGGGGAGINSKEVCFGRQNSSENLNILPGIAGLVKISVGNEVMEYKLTSGSLRTFANVSPISGRYSRLSGGFLLLKQHLLELSPHGPVDFCDRFYHTKHMICTLFNQSGVDEVNNRANKKALLFNLYFVHYVWYHKSPITHI